MSFLIRGSGLTIVTGIELGGQNKLSFPFLRHFLWNTPFDGLDTLSHMIAGTRYVHFGDLDIPNRLMFCLFSVLVRQGVCDREVFR